MAAATYTVAELADLLGVSDWSLYNCVKNGTSPVPPILVGKRIAFSKVLAARLLQLEEA
jgi:predicted DNA-binding transcriptional regulator AlpA